MMLKNCFFMALLAVSTSLFAQDGPPENWFNLDLQADGVAGMSVESAYKNVLKNRPSSTVIVAVLDSGVDPNHEDLQAIMWVNQKEATGKPGFDDDQNGYVDDIHGWNFLGNKNGQNLEHEAWEITRLLAKFKKQFAGRNPSSFNKADKKDYAEMLKTEDEYLEKKGDTESQLKILNKLLDDFESANATLKKELSKDDFLPEDLDRLSKSKDKLVQRAVKTIKSMAQYGYTIEQLSDAKIHYDDVLNYGLNLDYNPRPQIIKDNYADFSDRFYGNADVQGSDAGHGTHVAGIIAARRDNNLGIRGVADNVRIMAVRCVPDGDERDKDVALAIRYAVDNGAQVINMSFGKSRSPNKNWVDEAVKYARDHDVLLVHAAGNDNLNNDETGNFPNRTFAKKGLFKAKQAKNWLEIGAMSWKKGDDQIAEFSNYGQKTVDIFSPGVAIHSTVPGSKYKDEDGTSMASPAAAGVAAMLRSYFPGLTAVQVKEILMNSTSPITGNVKRPGSDDLVPAASICISGGRVNAQKAVELALKTTGKKKINAPKPKV